MSIYWYLVTLTTVHYYKFGTIQAYPTTAIGTVEIESQANAQVISQTIIELGKKAWDEQWGEEIESDDDFIINFIKWKIITNTSKTSLD
jgi:hypothetical protein